MNNRLTVVEALGDNVSLSSVQQAFFGLTEGTYSIFNKFSMFRYHKYGPTFTDYQSQFHFDGNTASNTPTAPGNQADQNQLNTLIGSNTTQDGRPLIQGTPAQNSNAANMFKAVNYLPTAPLVARSASPTDKNELQNPTARAIIDWSKNPNKVFGPTPYSWTDFIYCKWNGKIPNNRMVTLRRFPFPVRDNLKNISGDTLIPIAQAVTWFGEKTGNKLKDIIPGLSWSLPWKALDSQDGNGSIVQGNNLTIQEVLTALEQIPVAGDGLTKIKGTLTAFLGATAGANQNNVAIDKLSGRYDKYQDYLKNSLYSSAGPYWNQVLGGVNYITQTLIRDRMGRSDDWTKKIQLKFTYALRSFNGIKPKIAMLDLISNFLSLTYMNAEFKGNFSRFFRNAGVSSDATLDEQIAQLASQNKFVEALQLIAASVAYDTLAASAAVSDIKLNISSTSFRGAFLSGGATPTLPVGTTASGASVTLIDVANGALAATAFKSLAKGPIVMRSTLSGEPTGEWHMTVGNPIEPIATIGNLVCSGCQLDFGEELGPDDFPTELTFNVTLQMAKPRDKFEIESMFNLGNGFLTENPIIPPNSASSNTFDTSTLVRNGALNSPNQAQNVNSANLSNSQNNVFSTTKNRLKLAYGDQYANSAILPLYFMDNTRIASSTDLKGSLPVSATK